MVIKNEKKYIKLNILCKDYFAYLCLIFFFFLLGGGGGGQVFLESDVFENDQKCRHWPSKH